MNRYIIIKWKSKYFITQYSETHMKYQRIFSFQFKHWYIDGISYKVRRIVGVFNNLTYGSISRVPHGQLGMIVLYHSLVISLWLQSEWGHKALPYAITWMSFFFQNCCCFLWSWLELWVVTRDPVGWLRIDVWIIDVLGTNLVLE